MTSMDRSLVIIGTTLTAVLAVAAAFAPGAGSPSFAYYPVIIFAELIIYFVGLMVMNGRATIGMAAGGAVALAVIRALCSIAGGILAGLATADANYNALAPWVYPAAAIIQGAILLLAGPYVLAATVPGFIGETEARTLLGDGKARAKSGPGNPSEATPTGGFIQVFAFEELAALIRKSPGIEGFVIYSHEGLVVWRDLPLKVNTDTLTAKIVGASQAISATMDDHGLTKVRRVMVESREHFLFCTSLNQNFGIILLFNGRVAPEEIFSRIAVLAKSTREFLQWKYPSLPVAATAKETVAMETA